MGYQKSQLRSSDAINRLTDTLEKQFAAKGLKWPSKFVYLRSFKYDSQLELWVKNERKESYKLFKTYKICALAGTMGPKRMEGDYQVPEGYYYITEFNPKSSYHLSLGLNYPNTSDQILSDSLTPGSDIYIHGSCVTVGCIPLTDPLIEEVYTITAFAKEMGQDFTPVHIFPIRFNVPNSVDYLEKITKNDDALKEFSKTLEDGFNFFEKQKQLPVIMIKEDGSYIVNEALPKKVIVKNIESEPVKQKLIQHRVRKITTLANIVYQWPTYPGGGEAFMKYLDKLGKDLGILLPASNKKLYAQVEFIIDYDGVPVNFKIVKGLNEEFNDAVITKLETTMQNWSPAILDDKPVAKKLIQTIYIYTSQ